MMNRAVSFVISLVFVLYVSGITSQSSLTRLYNKKVVKAERMERPLQSTLFRWLPHAGVRVTTEDGEKWLVHKTKDQGSSDTVVTRASGMSSAWDVVETKFTSGRHTVADYVEAGGTQYSLLMDNCWDAARRMMRLP